tara:strand:+ start:1099 stop:1944 length:846 start_codon:yes stop_codon:yes gene_type:complete
MKNEKKRLELIEDLATQQNQITVLRKCKRNDPEFKNWEIKTRRILKKIFGNGSQEEGDFSRINYWYMYGGFSYEKITEEEYDKNNLNLGLDEASLLLGDLIIEAKSIEDISPSKIDLINIKQKKIFISHSSKDNEIGKEVINLLQLIGIKHNQIFYTSAAGYGIPLGKDWVETLKTEVSGEGIVISLLSDNYFTSQICLLEMGATWVLSKHHIPILIPPLNFKSVNEVINAIQGFMITDKLKWSTLKKDLEKLFDIDPLPEDKWEPQRDAILDRISKLLPS